MAKSRLNKNLVGTLTFVAMGVVVLAAGLVSVQLANRDPQAIAARAAELEAGGSPDDLKRAFDLYFRAYAVRRDTEYALDAARCAFRRGDINGAMGLLREANTRDPNDVQVLTAMLEKLWDLRIFLPNVREAMKEPSERLVELEPNNVLALTTRAEALRWTAAQDPNQDAAAEALAQKAFSLAPTDPRAATLWADYELRRVRDATPPTAGPEQLQQRDRAIIERVVEVLTPAWRANPKTDELVLHMGRMMAGGGDLPAARSFLEQALQANPDSAAARQLLANVLASMARRAVESAPDQVPALVAAAREQAQAAVKLEPASYDAYGTLADLEILTAAPGELSDADVQRYASALTGLREALESTVKLQTLRGVLADAQAERAMVMARGFEIAVQLRSRGGTAEARDQGDKFAQTFVDMSVTQYPTSYLASVMSGELAFFRGQDRLAINEFLEAERRMAGQAALARMGIQSKERLMQLYERVGEHGAALKSADEAIQAFQAAGQEPGLGVLRTRIAILLRLGENQAALDQVEVLRGRHPEDEALRRLRAQALSNLGRGDDARAALGDANPEDKRGLIYRAQLAAADDDWAKAEGYLTQVLQRDPNSPLALNLYVQVMQRSERQAEALKFIQGLPGRENQDFNRRLQIYEIVLGSADSAERDARLLKLISEIPDEAARAAETYNFYSTREKLDEAGAALDALEKLKPENQQVFEQQFQLALRRKDYGRAEQYSARLGRMNADLVGGARYRGLLRAAQGNYDQALQEFTAAARELPGDSDLRLRLADVLLKLPQPNVDEALRNLREALEFDPSNFGANKLLYALMEQRGEGGDAVEYLQRAARANPQDPFIKERMQLVDEAADPRKGVAAREAQLEAKPDDQDNAIRLLDLYGKLLEKGATPTERPDLVRKGNALLQRMQASAADNASLGRAAARYFDATGQRDAGAAYLKELAAKTSSGAGAIDLRVALARFLERGGDRVGAEQQLQEAGAIIDTALEDEVSRKRARVAVGLELAEYYNRGGQPAQQIAAAEAVLPLAEGAVAQRLQLQVIEALLRAQQFDAAEKRIDTYAEAYPREMGGLLARVQLMLARPQGDADSRRKALEDARELLTRLVRDNPQAPMPVYLRGAVNMDLARNYQQAQRIAEAREDLVRARQITATGMNMVHRRALAQLYEFTQDLAQAERELRDVVDAAGTDENLTALIQFYARTNQSPKAQQYLGERIARDPANPYWPHQLGLLLLRAKEHPTAIRYLTDARRAYEKSGQPTLRITADLLEATLAFNRDRPQVDAGRAREAVAMFEALPPAAITPGFKALGAEAYAQARDLSKAQSLLQEALTLSATPAGSPAQMSLVSQTLTRLLTPEDATRVFEAASQASREQQGGALLDAMYAGYLLGPGMQKSAPAQRDQLTGSARRLIESVTARAPAGSPTWATGMLLSAQLSDLTGNPGGVIDSYQKLLEKIPDHLEGLNNLAFHLVERVDRAADALPYAQRLRSLVDSQGVSGGPRVNMLDTVGWVFSRNDKLREAEAALLEAERLDPSHLEVRYHLGQTLAKLGRAADARARLQRARELATQTGNEAYLKKINEALGQLQ